jgi:hypothetical protein
MLAPDVRDGGYQCVTACHRPAQMTLFLTGQLSFFPVQFGLGNLA